MPQLTGYANAFGGDTSQVDSTQMHELGTRARDLSGNEYIYLQGKSSVSANDAFTFDESYAISDLTADAVGPVAVAMAAVDSTSKYGWFCIYGQVTVAADDTVSDNSALFIDGTDKRVDDDTVSGDLIVGAVARSTSSSNTITAQLNYPFVTNNLG